jgi:hypothetical protein
MILHTEMHLPMSIGDNFYFYQILTAFNKLKIMSEIHLTIAKRLKKTIYRF